MMKRLSTFAYGFLLAFALLGGSLVAAGVTRISFGTALPTNCVDGNIFVKTSATTGVYWCSTAGSPGSWSAVSSGSSGTVTHTAGALTSNAVMVGAGSDDSKVLASLGSSGDVLTSNGAGTPPSFQAPTGGGGGAPLESHTASASASLDFTTCISSTYDIYKFEITGLVPATTSTNLVWRGSTNAGVSWDSGAGKYAYVGIVHGVGGGGNFGSASATFGALNKLDNMVNTSTKPISGTFWLRNPLSTTLHKTLGGHIDYWDTAPNIVTDTFSSSYLSTTAMDAIQFFMVDGGGTVRNITSGDIYCYGVEK